MFCLLYVLDEVFVGVKALPAALIFALELLNKNT